MITLFFRRRRAGSRVIWLSAVVVLIGLGLVIALSALLFGTPRLTLLELWNLLLWGEGERLSHLIVYQLRLPRLVIGMLAGAALALAGALLQDALRNPLAGPELLGVSAGATAVMAVIAVFGLPVAGTAQPWLALTGALTGGALVLALSRKTKDTVRLLLIGAALSALLNAFVVGVISLGSASSVSMLYLYLLGSLSNRSWDHLLVIAPWVVLGTPLALLSARLLNVLRLGDEMAEGLGVRVARARLLLMLLAAGLVAAVVTVCGPIGFVALLAPHIARALLGTSDARYVLPVAALLGVVLLTGADLAARHAFAPREVPVGVWTTMVGGPLLLVLLRRYRRSGS